MRPQGRPHHQLLGQQPIRPDRSSIRVLRRSVRRWRPFVRAASRQHHRVLGLERPPPARCPNRVVRGCLRWQHSLLRAAQRQHHRVLGRQHLRPTERTVGPVRPVTAGQDGDSTHTESGWLNRSGRSHPHNNSNPQPPAHHPRRRRRLTLTAAPPATSAPPTASAPAQQKPPASTQRNPALGAKHRARKGPQGKDREADSEEGVAAGDLAEHPRAPFAAL